MPLDLLSQMWPAVLGIKMCGIDSVKMMRVPCASVFLSRRLRAIVSLLRDRRCATVGTMDPIGLAQLANRFMALGGI